MAEILKKQVIKNQKLYGMVPEDFDDSTSSKLSRRLSLSQSGRKMKRNLSPTIDTRVNNAKPSKDKNKIYL